MILTAILVIFSLGILIISAGFLIKSAEKLARKIGISPLIIGATIVAIGTSLPELVVSVVGCLEKQAEIAIANIVGSNITNITLVFGLAILGGNLRVGTTKTQINNLVLFFVTILFVLGLLFFENIPQPLGFLWIFLYLGFLSLGFLGGILGREEEDKEWFKKVVQDSKEGSLWGLLFLPLGIFGLVWSGDLFVKNLVLLTQFLGISSSFLGLTFIALGTSLPELMTSLVGTLKKKVKLVEGNILGSNIFNLFLIGGIISVISNLSFKSLPIIGFLVFSMVLGFLCIILNKGKVINRIWGIALLLVYFVFLYSAWIEK